MAYSNRKYTEEEKRRKERLLVKAIENIYSAVNPTYVSLQGVAENIVLHLYSGSKTACNLLGKTSASGSYWTVQNTLTKLTQIRPQFPKGDIIVVYDNNQVIGKQYGVSFLGSQPSSTMTGITVVVPNLQMSIQNRISIRNILPTNLPEYLLTEYENLSKEVTETHRLYRAQFIEERLKDIKINLKYDGSRYTDNIDEDSFVKSEENSLRYTRVPQGDGSCEISDQECLLLNPNSEDTIKQVLDHVQRESKKSDPDRKWYGCIIHAENL